MDAAEPANNESVVDTIFKDINRLASFFEAANEAELNRLRAEVMRYEVGPSQLLKIAMLMLLSVASS